MPITAISLAPSKPKRQNAQGFPSLADTPSQSVCSLSTVAAPKSIASGDSTEWRLEETSAPTTLSKKILSWWKIPTAQIVQRLPKPLIQFAERKLLFPGANAKARKQAPDLQALKQSFRKYLDEAQCHPIDRIQEVFFVSQQGCKPLTHRGWFVPPQNNMPTLLVSSPNMGTLNQTLDLLPFTLMGYGVLTYEYPGYGKTEGKPTEESLYRSVEAASDYLSRQHHIPAQQQIAYGVSLGAAVSAHLAAQRPLKGAILESTFTSVPEAAQHLLQKHIHPGIIGNRLSKKLQARFDNTAKVGQIQCPLLILHGDQDPLLPVDFAQRLYQKATSPQKTLKILESQSHIIPSTEVEGTLWEFLSNLQHESRVQGNGH